jgi:hypothetical protein
VIEIGSITEKPIILPTNSDLSWKNHWDHFLARVGVRRNEHQVKAGLYSFGKPTAESPVFVSANYTLSFDALRTSLQGNDGYILVLDTKGINVWCAAGKGTFGTEELVRRIMITHLKEVVSHRKLILPQLGAPGVAAHEVKKQSGFWVEYGPVRAADLPDYLKNHAATPEMRKVQFTLKDRLVLIPVDLKAIFLPMLAAAIVFYFIGGWVTSLAVFTAVLAGNMLFPILLPWIPTHNFSSKGFLLGMVTAIPFALSVFWRHGQWSWWGQAGQALGYLLAMPVVTAFIGLNFTGSSTFTSRSGVRKEIRDTIPAMAWIFGAGSLLTIVFAFVH